MNILNVVTKVRVGLILLVTMLLSTTAWAVATPVRYIDENGDVQEISDYTKVAVNKDGALNIKESGWYVVKGSIYATKAVNIYTDVNLVLTDSSELTIDISADSTENQTVFNVGRLAIYSQEDQSGTLTLESSANVETSYGIAAYGNVIIAGGYVKSTARYAIYTVGKTIRIIRGTVSVDAPAKIINSNGLNSENIIIDGGRIFANSNTGSGFFAENNLSINGGYIEITGKGNGCFVRNDFFMMDGSIKIQAAKNGIKSTNGNIYISGGSIDATALIANIGKIVVSGGSIDLSEQYINGISANDSLVLGWTNTYDYIKSPGFSSGKAVVVGAYDKDGTLVLNSISFKDENGNGYTGDITGNLEEIQNKKLTPAFKIAFETGDENVVVDPLFVGVNGTSTKPADPKRNGYKFIGWYTDKDLKTEFDWNEKITQDITLYAKWKKELPPVEYLDEKGETKTITNYIELTGDESPDDPMFKNGGWFVVKGEVTYDEVQGNYLPFELQIDKDWNRLGPDVNLILADGAKLTAKNENYDMSFRNLAVYAQSTGENMGKFEVYAENSTAISVFNAFTVYGGSVKAVSEESDGIWAGSVTVNGGIVYAAGTSSADYSGYGIYASDENVIVNGGSVTAAGFRGILGSGGIEINGGDVDATATGVSDEYNFSYAIGSWYDVNVNGGSLTVHAKDKSSYGVYVSGSVAHLNAGEVFADGEGSGFAARPSCSSSGVELAGATVTTNRYTYIDDLGPKSDFFVKVAVNVLYTDGEGNVFEGSIFKWDDLVGEFIDKLDVVAGKTLRPVKPNIVVTQDGEGKIHAEINGNYIGEDDFIITDRIEVDEVKFERDFTTEGYSTIVLPFNIKTSLLVGVDSVLSFNGIVLDENKKKAVAMQVVWEKSMEEVELQAYTPYMIKMSDKSLEILGSVVLETTRDAVTEKDGWEFRGTYSFMKWTEDSPDLGRAYAIDENGTLVQLKVGDETFPFQVYVVARTFEIADIENQFYTGNTITPKLVVTLDGNVLADSCYTVEYTDNKNEGTASVTVRGIGDYASLSPRTVQFEIVPPYVVNNGELNQNVTAGNSITAITIDFYGVSNVKCENLPSGLAYQFDAENGQIIIAGTTDSALDTDDYDYRVVATMENGEEYVVQGVFSVTNENGTTARVVENEVQKVNVGDSIKPISFKFGNMNTYEVTGLPGGNFENQVDATSKVFTITGFVAASAVGGQYGVRLIAEGENNRDTAFASIIVNKSLMGEGIVVDAIADQEWTGEAIEPNVIVKDGDDKVLVKGRDYTLSYSDNVKAGVASVTIEGMDVYSGSLTTTFEILTPVKYLDETGKEQTITMYHKLTGKEDANSFKDGGWYLAEGEVVFNDNFVFDGQDVNIILADKAKLTVNSSSGCVFKNLTIYAQSTGKEMGEFVFKTTDNKTAWYAYSAITINGGNVSVSGGVGIYASEKVVVNGGVVNVTAEGTVSSIGYMANAVFVGDDGVIEVNGGSLTAKATSGSDILTNGSLSLNGGTVVADGNGIEAAIPSCSSSMAYGVELGGATVKAASYTIGSGFDDDGKPIQAQVSIADGLYYTDGEGNSFSGTLTEEQIAAIAGKTIHSYIPAIQFRKFKKSDETMGTLADFNANYNEIVPFEISEEMTVDSVEFKREFTTVENGYATVLFPFDVQANNLEGVENIVEFGGVNAKYQVMMNVVWKNEHLTEKDVADGKVQPDYTLKAHTPYMVHMNQPTLNIHGPVTLKPIKEKTYEIEIGNWKFIGTYVFKEWSANDKDLGHAYGYTTVSTNSFSAGQFVVIAKNAITRAFRAYLVETQPQAIAARKPFQNNVGSQTAKSSSYSTPEYMEVVIIDKDEEGKEHTTVIGRFNTRTGEIKLNPAGDRVYDLKGRSIRKDAKKAKGVYYGKKVGISNQGKI